MTASHPERGHLQRRLTTTDASVIGIGAMLGAGVFSAFTPAAQAAGSGLLLGLVLAASIAYCNAMSSARLASLHPLSGGTYVYGRERLGQPWGYLAGWSFVTGKIASCAAMALTVGHHLVPGHPKVVAAAAVAVVLGVDFLGVRRSALVTGVIVVVVLLVLAACAGAALGSGRADADRLVPADIDLLGVAQSAGFLFFAFAGYARVATLGEEVTDPSRVIPRAIRISFAVVLTAYVVTGMTMLSVLGAAGVAATPAPLSHLPAETGALWLEPVVRAAAALAALGALLGLILGISRTTLGMARDRFLPVFLDAVSARSGGPYRAELAVGMLVVGVVVAADVRAAIGFSSFLVLVYYAITNAAALTLDASRRRRVLPLLGLFGCLLVALLQPLPTVAAGVGVLMLGLAVWRVTRPGPGSTGGSPV